MEVFKPWRKGKASGVLENISRPLYFSHAKQQPFLLEKTQGSVSLPQRSGDKENSGSWGEFILLYTDIGPWLDVLQLKNIERCIWRCTQRTIHRDLLYSQTGKWDVRGAFGQRSGFFSADCKTSTLQGRRRKGNRNRVMGRTYSQVSRSEPGIFYIWGMTREWAGEWKCWNSCLCNRETVCARLRCAGITLRKDLFPSGSPYHCTPITNKEAHPFAAPCAQELLFLYHIY